MTTYNFNVHMCVKLNSLFDREFIVHYVTSVKAMH